MVGSWLTYAVGYYGRVDLLERNRLIHLSPARLAWVDGWFKRHGDATVFLARLLPLVRAFISLPAGLAKMPFWRFTWLTALGSLPWVIGFGADRPGGRRQLGTVAPPPADPRLPGRRGDRRAGRLRDRQAAARPAGPATARRPSPPAPGALERGGRRADPDPARDRAGDRPGAGRAAAGLQLRPHRPRPLAGRLGLGGDRPGGAQELRGGPARRRRGGAADRPAAADRRGAAQLRPAPGGGAGALLRSGGGRRLHAGAADRAAAGRAAGDRHRPAGRSGGDGGRRPAPAGARPRGGRLAPTGWRWAWPRRRRWRRGSRATASPWPPPAGAASPASRRTCSRAPSRCRSSSARAP